MQSTFRQVLDHESLFGRRCIRALAAFAAIFGFAAVALAQDAATADAGASEVFTSFAEAFFWAPGSYFGTAQIWFLLALSVFAFGLMGYLWVVNRRINILPEASLDEARRSIEARQYRELLHFARHDPSYFGAILAAALGEASHGFGAMMRALEDAADEHLTRRLRRIEALNVVGNIAPMIGLFGTVYGMILAFQTLVATGARARPVDLAAGIGTALVTTFWGLVIAIPAIAAYAFLRNKVDGLTGEAFQHAQELLSVFRPASSSAPAGGGASVVSTTPQPPAGGYVGAGFGGMPAAAPHAAAAPAFAPPFVSPNAMPSRSRPGAPSPAAPPPSPPTPRPSDSGGKGLGP